MNVERFVNRVDKIVMDTVDKVMPWVIVFAVIYFAVHIILAYRTLLISNALTMFFYLRGLL